METLVERIKNQLKYCNVCKTDAEYHATATRVADMIKYHYFMVDRDRYLELDEYE